MARLFYQSEIKLHKLRPRNKLYRRYLIGFFWGGIFCVFFGAFNLDGSGADFYVVGLGLLMKQDVFGDFPERGRHADGDRNSCRP